jgi:hypothetical protein
MCALSVCSRRTGTVVAWDEDRLSYVDGMQDDTPLNISLASGNLQQPCQRYVLGGNSGGVPYFYSHMYIDRFGLKPDGKSDASLCSLTSSLRGANDCMLFNANNLRKASLGNVEYEMHRSQLSCELIEVHNSLPSLKP